MTHRKATPPLNFSAISDQELAVLAAPIAKIVRHAIEHGVVLSRSAPDQIDDRVAVPTVCRILALCALAARDRGMTTREPTLSRLDMIGAALLGRLSDTALERWHEEIVLDWVAARDEARQHIEHFHDAETAVEGGEPERFPTPWRRPSGREEQRQRGQTGISEEELDRHLETLLRQGLIERHPTNPERYRASEFAGQPWGDEESAP